MLHFLVSDWPDHLRARVERAVFELGLRIGSEFCLHRTESSLPADATVVRYSALRSPAPGAGVDLVAVPAAYETGGECRTVSWQNNTLWGAKSASAPDVIAGVDNLLRFAHESSVPAHELDSLGRIPVDRHPLTTAGVLEQPLLENNAKFVAKLLDAQRGVDIKRVSPWGEGKYLVCITHDVDGPSLHSTFAMLRSVWLGILRGNRSEREALQLGLLTLLRRRPDPYWNFEQWMEWEALVQAKSTFYFVPDRLVTARRHRRDPRYSITNPKMHNILRQIADAGWEIGLHTGIRGHACRAYHEARRVLEIASGQTVRGCRAHYWAINWSNPYESWHAMREAGLDYDASINPMAIGYRGGSMYPIHIHETDTPAQTAHKSLLAFPTVIMDAYLVESCRKHGSECVEQLIDHIVQRAQVSRGLIVLDWHVRTLLNRGPWKGYLRPLMYLLNRCHGDSSCRFATMSEATDLWNDYTKRIFCGVEGETGHGEQCWNHARSHRAPIGV